MKRAPDSEALSKSQSIMNTWGYHKSNASIGDAPLMFGGNVLGLTVKGIATNAACHEWCHFSSVVDNKCKYPCKTNHQFLEGLWHTNVRSWHEAD